MSVRSRLEKLETASANASPTIVWLEDDETPEQALARLGIVDSGTQILFIRFRRNADEVAD